MAKKMKDFVLPKKGLPHDEILAMMDEYGKDDADFENGKLFALVYYAGEEHEEFLKKAQNKFFSTNALNPMAFPSLKRFEGEVISMMADLLGGDRKVYGSLTTGGTESILMAVKTYREWAREKKPHVKKPEMIIPSSAHAAFRKASHYFDVDLVVVPVGKDDRADVEAMAAAITDNTILLVGSAVDYPRGVVDPIPEIAALAKEHKIGMHVDGCLGGMMLKFLEKLGYDIPPYDFRVPGVTSMSCDIHKYGFVAKGASIVLYRNEKLWKHQFYANTSWNGGIYASPSMPGSRNGGLIAQAWAGLMAMGEDGYLELARKLMDTTQRMKAGIEKIDGIHVLGDPRMTVFAFAADDPDSLDIYQVGDEMEKRGWVLDRLQMPPALHVMVLNVKQADLVDEFLADLEASVKHVKEHPEESPEGKAALYGMMATFKDKKALKDVVLGFIADQYKV